MLLFVTDNSLTTNIVGILLSQFKMNLFQLVSLVFGVLTGTTFGQAIPQKEDAKVRDFAAAHAVTARPAGRWRD